MPGSLPSASNSQDAAGLVSIISQLMDQQQQANISVMEVMMRSLDHRSSGSMKLAPFDSSNSDAKGWMIMFERTCQANNWVSDKDKITSLKCCFKEGTTPSSWFNARLVDFPGSSWDEWKDSFLTSFTENRILSAEKALCLKYVKGNIMEYYYEKETLIRIAFSDLGDESFITIVILGLPPDLQIQVMVKGPTTKSALVSCLQTLPDPAWRT